MKLSFRLSWKYGSKLIYRLLTLSLHVHGCIKSCLIKCWEFPRNWLPRIFYMTSCFNLFIKALVVNLKGLWFLIWIYGVWLLLAMLLEILLDSMVFEWEILLIQFGMRNIIIYKFCIFQEWSQASKNLGNSTISVNQITLHMYWWNYQIYFSNKNLYCFFFKVEMIKTF